MPLYEYRCEACGHRFDLWFPTYRAAAEAPPPSCPDCGATSVRRLIARVVVHGRSGDETAGEAEAEEAPVEEKPKVFGRKELNEIMEQRRSMGLE